MSDRPPFLKRVDGVGWRVLTLLARHSVPHSSQVAAISIFKGLNEIWSVDFKGKLRLGDGRYCYPLTVILRIRDRLEKLDLS